MGKKIKFKTTSNIKKTDYKWITTVIIITFILSIMFSLLSSSVMPVVHIWFAMVLLMFIIFFGIIFDIVGIAVTAADETQFHSMASRRVKGAKQAIFLVRNAEKVSNFCNDVVGDICGIIAGSAVTLIVVRIANSYNFKEILLSLAFTGVVSAITVGGKGIGKAIAMKNAHAIIYDVAMLKYYIDKIFSKGD